MGGAEWFASSCAASSAVPEYQGTKSLAVVADEYVNLGAPWEATSQADPFTVSLWIKPNNVVTNTFILGHPAASWLPRIQMLSSRLYAYNEIGSRRSASTISTGSWIHVLFTSDGVGFPTLYINGAVSGGTTGAAASTRTPLVDMWAGALSTFFYNGKMHNLAIWTGEVISGADIAEVYNSGTSVDLTTISNPPDNYWEFGTTLDDATGTTGIMYDRAGSYNGTPINTEPSDLVTDAP